MIYGLDDPLVVSILDGNTLKLFLEDEDDYAMLAENLSTDLDIGAKGKICKSEIRNALFHMGVEIHLFQETADALTEKHVVTIQDIKAVNGSKLIRKLLAYEKQFSDVIQRVLQEKKSRKDKLGKTKLIRIFLEEHGKDLGLPPAESNEAVVLFYDVICSEVDNKESAAEVEDELREYVKDILEKFAEQLEANPVYYDLDN
ncbi:hypothetical protein REPUB_Repub16aG0119900 [Reevesia pubescens]